MVEHGAGLSWQGRVVRRFLASVRQLTLWAGIFSLSVVAAFGQPAHNARPRGGTVVAGQARISFGPGVVNITSSTPQAVIDWQSFDIGVDQQVVITGPSVNATVLNRVIGRNPSQIAGHLNSKGQVYLVNGSGITYYQGAQVDVHGFVSTSTDITNSNFMSGNLNFENAGKATALIANGGEIKVSDGGMLALVAPGVSNSGVIRAPLGSISLLSASTFQLGANTGTILVKGGTVAGVVVTGTLDASGPLAGETGGSVQVVGSSTELAATSVIDASGEAGGGVVAIGTSLARAKGGPGTVSSISSNTVLINRGAQISADALAAGNGGRVVVLAITQTNFDGAITTRGGPLGGDGGFVEVSGGVLAFTGTVDATGPSSVGTFLLDPFDFVITTPVANALSAHMFEGRSGKLIIQADHDIEVDAAIDGRGGVPGTQLIFNAGNQVRLNADVFTNNAPVEIDAGAGCILASPETALCAGAFSITVKSQGSTGPQELMSCSLPQTR